MFFFMLSSSKALHIDKHIMSPTPSFIPSQKLNLQRWWITASLMAINILLFLWQISTGVDSAQPKMIDALAWGADYAPLTFLHEPWRLFSSMFFHFGMIHLMLNMWALYIFGSVAEQLFGRLYFIGVYVCAGLMGSLLSGFLDIQHSLVLLQHNHIQTDLLPRVSAGASGAVMGLGGALTLLSLLPILKQQRFILDKKTLLMVMGINLIIGILTPGINNAAHIGGMIIGAILALCWYLSSKINASWLKPLSCGMAILACWIFYQYCQSLVVHITPFWQQVLAVMYQGT